MLAARYGKPLLLVRSMARGILFQLGHLLISARELFIRAPDLFISLLERCDRDIVRINLFRVRHRIHLAHLVRPTSPKRPSDFHTADQLLNFYQSLAAMESIGTATVLREFGLGRARNGGAESGAHGTFGAANTLPSCEP